MKHLSLSLLALFFVTTIGQASAAGDTVTLTVEQVGPKLLGTWTLIYPGGSVKSTQPGIESKKHTLYPKTGMMLLGFTPSPGNSARVKVYKDGALVEEKSIPQVSLMTETGATYRVVAQYSYDKLGTIGVTSTPTGQSFRLIGPGGVTYRGTTPQSFKNVAVGSYTLRMNAMKDCVLPRPVYAKVEANEREALEVSYNCNTIVKTRVNRGPTKREVMDAAKAREAARAASRRR